MGAFGRLGGRQTPVPDVFRPATNTVKRFPAVEFAEYERRLAFFFFFPFRRTWHVAFAPSSCWKAGIP